SWDTREGEVEEYGFFPILGYKKNDHFYLLPLYVANGPEGDRSHWGPIYYYKNTDNSLDLLLGPFLYGNENYGTESTSFHIFPLFYNWWEGDRYTGFEGIVFLESEPGYSRQYIPLLYENIHSQNDSGSTRDFSMLLHTISYESAPRRAEFSFFFRIVAGYKSHTGSSNSYLRPESPLVPVNYALNSSGSSSAETDLDIDRSSSSSGSGRSSENFWNFNLLSFVVASSDSSFHQSFVPLYWYGSDSESTAFHLFPLLTLNYWEGNEYKGLFGPVYVHTIEGQRSRYYTPLLFEYDWRKTENNQEYGSTTFLLNAFDYEADSQQKAFTLLYGLGKYSSDDRDTAFHNHFLPVYWYDRDSYRSKMLLPPLLTYSYESEKASSRWIVLGLLYYRDRDDKKQTDLNGYLLNGLLYYDNYRGSQNGFHEWGSLYGWLWDYEVEPGSNYEKISFLKFVFSRTKDSDGTHYRIFGAKFGN
ncbi:MAG: hypothetical protein KDK37_10270, partial [Leptospiraceae bacterium]|nr:hypothetical protein [Leptospiraceae bacterium]